MVSLAEVIPMEAIVKKNAKRAADSRLSCRLSADTKIVGRRARRRSVSDM